LKIATTIKVLMTTFLALVAVQSLGADIGNITAMSLSTAMADCEIPEWAAKVRVSVSDDLKETFYTYIYLVFECKPCPLVYSEWTKMRPCGRPMYNIFNLKKTSRIHWLHKKLKFDQTYRF
jgi:hypothetical protein